MSKAQAFKCQKPKCACPARYKSNGHFLCGRCCPVAHRTKELEIKTNTTLSSGVSALMSHPNESEIPKVVFYNDVGGRYAPFGMFHEAPFTHEEVIWKTAEHAYQAKKFHWSMGRETLDDKLFKHCQSIADAPNGIAARKLGKEKTLPIRYDWNHLLGQVQLKCQVMIGIIMAKVEQNPEICNLLLDTGDAQIVLGNADEKYWGCENNMLGEVYMLVRETIRRKRSKPVEP